MRAAALADLLVAARQGGAPVGRLADDLLPREDADAYAVQEAAAARLGLAVAGWKVGAPNPAAGPSGAPLFAPLVQPSPARFPAAEANFRAVEAELALTLARDLPARGQPYGEDEVWDAVAALHVAIELLESRYAERRAMPAAAMLADNLSNGGFCYSAPIAAWRGVDFLAAKATLLVNGKAEKEAVGGNPAGHPKRLLAWLANHAATRGRPLRRGQVVTTGSHTGVTIAPPGAELVARFAGLGEARMRLV